MTSPRRFVWLKDAVDFKAIALRLSKFDQYSSADVEDLERTFRQFFWQEGAVCWWFYGQKQCQKQIDELVKRFVESVAASLISD